MSTGQPPWHMWGNTQTLNLPGFTIPAGDTHFNSSLSDQSQLVDVRYLRPDTFRFLFQAKLLLAPDLTEIAESNGTVEVNFDLITGIGRSNIVIPSFAQLNFKWLVTEDPPVGAVLFTTAGKGWQTFIGGALSDAVVADQVTAQSIQLQARARVIVVRGGSDFPEDVGPASVSVSAHFSPNVHVRPEWHSEQFNGDEQGVS